MICYETLNFYIAIEPGCGIMPTTFTIIGGNRAQIPSSLASRLFWGINILICRGTLISNHQVPTADRLTRKFSVDSG